MQRIRRIDLSANMTSTWAGTGTPGFNVGDGVDPGTAEIRSPTAVAYKPNSLEYFFTDTGNQVVRAFNSSTSVGIKAGLDPSRSLGTPNLAQSLLFSPTAVATGGSSVYVEGAQFTW